MPVVSGSQRGPPCAGPVLQVEEEDDEFVEEFLSAADPSILHFLLASGEQVRPPRLGQLSCLHLPDTWTIVATCATHVAGSAAS